MKIVLFVEDDLNDVSLFHSAVRRAQLDYRVEVARDGQEAIEWLQAALQGADRGRFPVPDVVISDLKMPRKDGFELLQWIRTHPQFHSLPFALLTSSGQQSDRDTAHKLGIAHYFEKTIRFEKIIAYLKTLAIYSDCQR